MAHDLVVVLCQCMYIKRAVSREFRSPAMILGVQELESTFGLGASNTSCQRGPWETSLLKVLSVVISPSFSFVSPLGPPRYLAS